ncbi:hypothetical protein SAMN03159507_04036 [Pseudomonas sp. NFACC32-1]|nr:hypothetical protein SAMN03159507_04036 [Pseudomonas sp. NFACC32-1]SFX93084.1 hypothetical protein SAMN03159352_02585 [Pseudomonas sp. NFACC43]SFX98441.1 hypothetical protein SAMN03159390_03311 [Pseudomonas sp. NFACC49-2]SFX99551.1 hypothetical protein SAMN03159442_03672 [Pseudomonas sp. NFACC47-1]
MRPFDKPALSVESAKTRAFIDSLMGHAREQQWARRFDART